MSAEKDTQLEANWKPAVNFEPRRNDMQPNILVMHYTAMASADAAINWLCKRESGVSCHYLVDEDGLITQMVREEMRAWHAGESGWAGIKDVNSASIGIEIANPGHASGYPDFPEAQISAVRCLSLDILSRHAIAPRNILAHSDIAPHRKADPGEKFDWPFLAANGVGHWVEPAPIGADFGMDKGYCDQEVLKLQDALTEYGYDLPVSGRYCERTRLVVTAFQRHFRPDRIDGRADFSTCETLNNLLAAL